MQISLQIGALAPNIEEQLAGFGLKVKDVDKYQALLDSVTRLLLQGYIPKSQADKARDKIIKDVFKHMKAAKGGE